MKDEQLIEAQMRRGEEAERLLNEPLLAQAFVSIEAQLIRDLKNVDTKDAEARDALWRDLRALERLRDKLKNYVRTGNTAKTIWQRITRG